MRLSAPGYNFLTFHPCIEPETSTNADSAGLAVACRRHVNSVADPDLLEDRGEIRNIVDGLAVERRDNIGEMPIPGIGTCSSLITASGSGLIGSSRRIPLANLHLSRRSLLRR